MSEPWVRLYLPSEFKRDYENIQESVKSPSPGELTETTQIPTSVEIPPAPVTTRMPKPEVYEPGACNKAFVCYISKWHLGYSAFFTVPGFAHHLEYHCVENVF